MTTLEKVCIAFVNRAEALGMKGVKRDEAALHYLLGAYAALEATEQKADANHIGAVCAMVISTRGYSEVHRIAQHALKEAHAGLTAAKEGAPD